MNVQTGYYGSGSILFNASVGYAYYANGSRATMTVPSGTFTYDYDIASRPQSLTNPFGETTSWSYYNNNWLANQVDDNSSGALVCTASYAYNERGFMTDLANTSSTGGTLSEFGSTNPTYAMTYDAVGNRTVMAVNDAVATGYSGTTDYSYDSRDELTQEASTRNAGYTNNFAYDGAENPTEVRSASVPAANSDNQIATSSYIYDGAGNPTTYAGNSLTFDPENRMIAYGSVLSCSYTADGLRAWKENSSGTTYFLYDDQTAVCELSSSGSVTATDTCISIGLISRNSSSASTFYVFDAQDSTAQRLSSSGAVAGSGTTDAFGAASGAAASDPYSGFEARLCYFNDSETGLVLLGHRYYDAATGRFLNRDPSGFAGGICLYAYCHNSPTARTDPGGFSCCPLWAYVLATALTAMIMIPIAAALTAACIAIGEAFAWLCEFVAACVSGLLSSFFFESIVAGLCSCQTPPGPPSITSIIETCVLGGGITGPSKGIFTAL
jgi:RHS repeat-associated protein